jgi:hypothetical protein
MAIIRTRQADAPFLRFLDQGDGRCGTSRPRGSGRRIIRPRFRMATGPVHDPTSASWSGAKVMLSPAQQKSGFIASHIQSTWIVPTASFYIPSDLAAGAASEAEGQSQGVSCWIGLGNDDTVLSVGVDVDVQYEPYSPYGTPLPPGSTRTVTPFVELWDSSGVILQYFDSPSPDAVTSVGDYLKVSLGYAFDEILSEDAYVISMMNVTQDFSYETFAWSMPPISATFGAFAVEIPREGLVGESLDVYWPSFPIYDSVVFDDCRVVASGPSKIGSIERATQTLDLQRHGQAFNMGNKKRVYSHAAIRGSAVQCWDYDLHPIEQIYQPPLSKNVVGTHKKGKPRNATIVVGPYLDDPNT